MTPESLPQTTSTVTSRGAAIVGMLITFAGGYVLGAMSGGQARGTPSAAASARRVVLPVAASPVAGPEDALVTVVEFSDFQCPFCARSASIQKRILSQYPGTVRWVFKNFPLEFHKSAGGAARAALAANAQGKFWPFHDRLFADQSRLQQADLLRIAGELGLDMVRFRTELDGAVMGHLVEEDIEVARRAGVEGTPSLFVNGRKIEGGANYRELEALIREELVFTGELLRRGVPRAKIYEELTRPAPASRPAAPASQPAS